MDFLEKLEKTKYGKVKRRLLRKFIDEYRIKDKKYLHETLVKMLDEWDNIYYDRELYIGRYSGFSVPAGTSDHRKGGNLSDFLNAAPLAQAVESVRADDIGEIILRVQPSQLPQRVHRVGFSRPLDLHSTWNKFLHAFAGQLHHFQPRLPSRVAALIGRLARGQHQHPVQR